LSKEEKATTTGHKQGLSSPFPSDCPGQAKKDSNCLPLRVYPDVLRSRLAGAKSGLLSLGAGDEPTPVWARCGGDLLWIILDNQHPRYTYFILVQRAVIFHFIYVIWGIIAPMTLISVTNHQQGMKKSPHCIEVLPYCSGKTPRNEENTLSNS
jgi:hypothetical protein